MLANLGMSFRRLLREDERAGEERLRRFSSVLDPRNDFEELLLSTVVEVSIELDRVGRARQERMVERIERAPEDELQGVHELGCRLFFDRAGPRTTYALWAARAAEKQTSWSGKPVDPDDPAMLVRKLEGSGAGCRWLASSGPDCVSGSVRIWVGRQLIGSGPFGFYHISHSMVWNAGKLRRCTSLALPSTQLGTTHGSTCAARCRTRNGSDISRD